VDIFTYPAEEENFASDDSSYLDTWVFDKVSHQLVVSSLPYLEIEKDLLSCS
jgi:hypothetical protein